MRNDRAFAALLFALAGATAWLATAALLGEQDLLMVALGSAVAGGGAVGALAGRRFSARAREGDSLFKGALSGCVLMIPLVFTGLIMSLISYFGNAEYTVMLAVISNSFAAVPLLIGGMIAGAFFYKTRRGTDA